MPSTSLKTPIGVLRVAANEKGVTAIEFPRTGRTQPSRHAARRSRDGDVEAFGAPSAARAAARRHLEAAVRQLREYFAGERDGFDLDLFMTGTDFEAKVWKSDLRSNHAMEPTSSAGSRAPLLSVVS